MRYNPYSPPDGYWREIVQLDRELFTLGDRRASIAKLAIASSLEWASRDGTACASWAKISILGGLLSKSTLLILRDADPAGIYLSSEGVGVSVQAYGYNIDGCTTPDLTTTVPVLTDSTKRSLSEILPAIYKGGPCAAAEAEYDILREELRHGVATAGN